MDGFATPEDVRDRWASAPEDDHVIGVLLEDAALWLRAVYPQIPVQPSEHVEGVLRMVSCSLVKRSLMAAESEHLQSETDTAGPFGRTRSYRNPEGNFYLTAQERAMLDGALGGRGGMVTVEARGW